MATDELVYSIGIDWDKIGFGNLNKSIDKSVKLFAAATAAATAASLAIFTMGKGYAESTDDLLKTSQRINTTTADLQKLTFAAEDNGATMDDVTSSLSSLSKAQYDVLRGKGDFEAWGRIGVNPAQFENTSDLLKAISNGMQNISGAERINIIERLGISRNLLQTLELGADGIERLGDEAQSLGMIKTADVIKSSQDFMSGWHRASNTVTGILNKVKSQLLTDTINPAIDAFNKFAKNNMQKIVKTLSRVFEVIAKISQSIFAIIQRMSVTFSNFVEVVGGVENAMIALGAVFVALKFKAIMAFAPALISVGLLWAAFDELFSFLNGKESFIGDFFGKFGLGAEDAKDIIKDFIDVTGGLLNKSFEGWKNLFEWIGYYIDIIIDKIESFTSPQWITDLKDFAKNTAASAMDSVINFATDGKGTSSSQTNNNNISINVNGAGNTEAVGESIIKQLDKYFDESAKRSGY